MHQAFGYSVEINKILRPGPKVGGYQGTEHQGPKRWRLEAKTYRMSPEHLLGHTPPLCAPRFFQGLAHAWWSSESRGKVPVLVGPLSPQLHTCLDKKNLSACTKALHTCHTHRPNPGGSIVVPESGTGVGRGANAHGASPLASQVPRDSQRPGLRLVVCPRASPTEIWLGGVPGNRMAHSLGQPQEGGEGEGRSPAGPAECKHSSLPGLPQGRGGGSPLQRRARLLLVNEV